MLIAAFKSRSITKPHFGHSYVRSDNFIFLIDPHELHIFVLGSNIPISMKYLKFQLLLYSICSLNSPHDTSLILFANLWFCTIPLMLSVSKENPSYLVIIP